MGYIHTGDGCPSPSFNTGFVLSDSVEGWMLSDGMIKTWRVNKKTLQASTFKTRCYQEALWIHGCGIPGGVNSFFEDASHGPCLIQRFTGHAEHHHASLYPKDHLPHYYGNVYKPSLMSRSDVDAQHHASLNCACHPPHHYNNILKASLRPACHVDASEAQHHTSLNPEDHVKIHKAGLISTGHMDVSEAQCHVAPNREDHLPQHHCNIHNADVIHVDASEAQSHVFVNSEYHPQLCDNICKASLMCTGPDDAFEAQHHASFNPQYQLPNHTNICKAGLRARAHVDASDVCHWDMLSSDEVLGVLSEMDDLPSIDDLICILQMCRRNKDLKYGKQLHAHVCKIGLEAHKIVGNHIVQMFVDCGSVCDARQVFSLLLNQNVYTWTSLMLGYIQCGQTYHVISMYQKMQEISLYPSSYTLVTLLKACARLKDMERGQKIYVNIIQRGIETDLFVGSTLVDMYAKCGLLLEAEDVFDKLPIRNVVSWSALITAYMERECAHEALRCFEQMQLEGVSPDAITFIPILKACGSIGAIEKAQEIHHNITQKGLEREALVGNSLVDMYAKFGSLAEACRVFNKMPFRDVVSWTALIAGYGEHGSCEELLLCFEKMQLEGVSPDATTFTSVLKACGSIGAIEKGREIHRKIEEKELDRELFVCSTLVDMYAKCGSISEAQEVFDKLPVRDAVLWNTLIAGYAEHGPCQEVLSCFEQMQLDGVWQGAVTFVCALKACGNMVAIDKGQEMHTGCTLRAFDQDLSVGSTLVDMYAKCGSLSEAQDVFDKLHVRDVASWNAMIKAHGINQEGDIAVHLFECMQDQGVKPDAVTFTCLLKACSRACLMQKGWEFLSVMSKVYGITPTIDHISCMVDLFARSGQLDEARKLLETMPRSPSDEIWRALLSACKTHTEPDLGLKCFEQLVQLNPECAASYVLMSNIYGNHGKWHHAHRLEELRLHAGAKKTPASALIEVNKKVHEFLVGSNQSKEISHFLETLSLRMVNYGHVPDLDGVLRLIPDKEHGPALCEFTP